MSDRQLQAEDFRVAHDDEPRVIPNGHPPSTSDVNRRCPSLWQCDFCEALESSPKPIVPRGWELVLSRIDRWWGEIHLVRCSSCKAKGEPCER